jgi:hypothetical protein
MIQNEGKPCRNGLKATLLAVVLFFGTGLSARADQFTFNFNSLASGAPASGGVGINASITNYMNNILGCNCVLVSGAVADKTYNGEGFSVGPGNGATSLTLGTSDGAMNNAAALDKDATGKVVYDTFIATTNDSSTKISTEMTMQFINGFMFSGNVSFDYQIFPDGTSGTNPANPPDFEFAVNGALQGVTVGVAPGTTNGGSTHSPKSGPGAVEPNLQYIGTWSQPVTNVTKLEFIDWPPTVAIDNLVISRVPEPASIFLFGSGLLASLALMRRKQRKS